VGFDPSRRTLLKTAALFALIGIPEDVWALAQDEELVDFDDLDNFKTESSPASPRIRFFDLRRLTSWTTPEDEFFSFHQTETVKTDGAGWALTVGGFVEKPLKLTLEQIKQRPDRRDLAVTIECSGNAAGPAANGMVSNGLWTGVGLASILKEAGIRPEAREVAFLGADMERERNSAAITPHGRSVYLQDALDPNAMIAYALNSKPLPAERGFPLRVMFPGWYGMTQIKWLRHIEVMDRRYEGPHMSRNYHTTTAAPFAGDDQVILETAISKTRLKSVVARVTRRKGPDGRYRYRISGAAWGGPSPVKAVEVTVDGREWLPTTIDERNGDFAWVLWSFDWVDAAPGAYTLTSRSIDSQGRVQPTLTELRKTIKSIREDNSQWPRKIVIKE